MTAPHFLLSQQMVLFYWLLDSLAVFISGTTAYYLRFQQAPPGHYISAVLFACFIVPFIFSLLQLYLPWREHTWRAFLFRFIRAMLMLFIVLAACGYFLKIGDQYSRSWFLVWVVSFNVIFLAFRFILFCTLRWIRYLGWNKKRIVIFGAGKLAECIVQNNDDHSWKGYEIIALLDDHLDHQPKFIQRIPVSAPPLDLSTYCEEQNIDEVWIALPMRAENRIHGILHELRHVTVPIRVMLNTLNMELFNPSITAFSGVPTLTVRQTPMSGLNRFCKALEDRIFSALILILISPLMLIIACIIKLTSKGPIFYRQVRIGWNGKEFEMLKFRSMPMDAETRTGPIWAQQHDQRVNGFGKFLRRTSLDELPQFINVLCGEMSIVGPRPERKIFVDQFKQNIPRYMQKHYVKAGITGWAQINGWRGNTSLEKRIEFDMYYIEHWSLWFDIKIIALTLFKGFINKNAY